MFKQVNFGKIIGSKTLEHNEKTTSNFDIRSRLAYRVQILANKMTAWSASNYSREFNIGVQESRILIVLAGRGGVTANQICEFGKMDKGNVSRAVKKLAREGRIKAKLDLNDKRSILLNITPSGLILYERIKEISDIREKKFISSLSVMERRSLFKILTNLEVVMDELMKDVD